jgi:transposase
VKPYSIDLRQKIVDAYAAGSISQRQLAANFGVAVSFVSKLLLRHKRYNTIEPSVRLLQTPSKLNEQQLETLREIVLAHSDATLSEIQQYLYNKTDVFLAISTLHQLINFKLGLTRKKKSQATRKK